MFLILGNAAAPLSARLFYRPRTYAPSGAFGAKLPVGEGVKALRTIGSVAIVRTGAVIPKINLELVFCAFGAQVQLAFFFFAAFFLAGFFFPLFSMRSVISKTA